MSVVRDATTTLETVATIAATAAGINQIARQTGIRSRVFWIGIGVGVGVGVIIGTALTASLGDATITVVRKILHRLFGGDQDQFNREYLV